MSTFVINLALLFLIPIVILLGIIIIIGCVAVLLEMWHTTFDEDPKIWHIDEDEEENENDY